MTALPDPQSKPSLRERLVRRVILPLALTWLLGTGMAIGVSYYFAQKAFDRALLDDAYSLASHVRLSGAELKLELSDMEMRTVLFDQSERVYFAVLRPDGTLVAGHPGLPRPPLGLDRRTRFAEMTYQGQTVRTVVIRLDDPEPFDVVVALTQGSRSALLNNLVLFSLGPELILLFLLGWWLRRTIDHELKPLAQLQSTIALRDALDLTPLSVSAPSVDVEQLALTINELLARIHQSMQAQREFSGNVAHELRTPLAGIRALADYGLSHKETAVWREQLVRIGESEARASRLVEQLLALALAEEADVAVSTETLALDEVIRETVLRFLAQADSARVDLGVAGLEQTVWVKGNRALLEGLLGNLLDNALRYGRAEGGQASIVTVALASSSNEVTLSVTDNGPGMSLEERQRLIQRGVRGVHADRLGVGAGLGLAIVAKFAKLMHAGFELRETGQGPGLCARLVFKRP